MHEHFLFYIGLSFILLHEMDAMRCREWRIFPGLNLLNNKLGQIIFVFAHLPLFYFIFYQLTSGSQTDNFIRGFDVFLVIHVGLHLLFLRHKNNEFKDWISWSIIIGAGFFGLTDFLLG